MRINNNLMAMNTHRQLGAANAGGAKSMEKLSSGMRINRAGDDAAGLAISEKMRGQIRGLNQASANSQDGISMIQTAEGALNETHAILQRMRELAVQSSNDTNVGVDRGEIQKEMNQLTSEINRIGNTTEFNTQKVLNGGGEVKDIQTSTMQKGSAAGAMKGSEQIGTAKGAAAVWDTGTITSGITAGGTESGTFEFNGVTITVTGAAAAQGTLGTANVTGANEVSITVGSTTTAPTAKHVADAIVAAAKAFQADTSTASDKLDNFEFTSTTDGVKITGDATDGSKNNAKSIAVGGTGFSVVNTGAAQLTTKGITEGAATTGAIEVTSGKSQSIFFDKADANKASDLTVKYASGGADAAASASIDGNEITITLGTDAANNTAAAVQTALRGLDLSGVGVDNSKIIVTGDDAATVANADGLTDAAKASNAVETESNIPVTTKTTSKAAVAAEWDTGELTALTNGQSGSISFADVTIDITAKTNDPDAGITGANQVGAKLALDITNSGDNAKQAQKIVDAFNAVKAEQSSTGSLANFTFEMNATGNGIKITGTKADGAANNAETITKTGDVAITGSAATTAGITESRGEYTFEIENAFEKAGATLNIGGEDFTAVASGAKAANGEFNVGTDAKEQAISIAAALNADSTLNARFDALVDGTKITLKEKALKATGEAVTNGVVSGVTNDAAAGKVSFNLDESVAVGGKYTVAGVNIEVTDDAGHKGLVDGSAVLFSQDTKQQANNLSNAIASNVKLNENFDVEASSDRITLTQKEGKESMTEAKISTSTSKNDSFQATFQVGANSGQGMTIDVKDMRSVALGISGEKAGAGATAKNGVKANYVTNPNVSNGTDNTTVEYSLDVSSHEKAQAAVSVINDAIESVSAQRSELGSYQNRLEHTIKNLDTSSENLQASEARIRDVDMAKEMMEQTRQNILAQASTAMLAQANQAPQAVLQLLR